VPNNNKCVKCKSTHVLECIFVYVCVLVCVCVCLFRLLFSLAACFASNHKIKNKHIKRYCKTRSQIKRKHNSQNMGLFLWLDLNKTLGPGKQSSLKNLPTTTHLASGKTSDLGCHNWIEVRNKLQASVAALRLVIMTNHHVSRPDSEPTDPFYPNTPIPIPIPNPLSASLWLPSLHFSGNCLISRTCGCNCVPTERKRGDRAERVKQKCISSDIYEVLSVWCVGIVPFLSFNIPYTWHTYFDLFVSLKSISIDLYAIFIAISLHFMPILVPYIMGNKLELICSWKND